MSSSLIDGSNKAVRDIFSNKMIALQKNMKNQILPRISRLARSRFFIRLILLGFLTTW